MNFASQFLESVSIRVPSKISKWNGWKIRNNHLPACCSSKRYGNCREDWALEGLRMHQSWQPGGSYIYIDPSTRLCWFLMMPPSLLMRHIIHIYWDRSHTYTVYIHTYRHTYIHTLHTLHYITLHYITLHCITLHYIALHYITLHTYIHTYVHTYITLHYITFTFTFTFTLHYITIPYIHT